MVHEEVDPDPITISQLFHICRAIADRGEGRAAMKLGEEIVGVMERIRLLPTDLLAKVALLPCT